MSFSLVSLITSLSALGTYSSLVYATDVLALDFYRNIVMVINNFNISVIKDACLYHEELFLKGRIMVGKKKPGSPEDLQGVAAELRKLAGQIEVGQITVGGVTLSLGNTVSLKVKQKLVGGQVKLDVSLAASLVDEESATADRSADQMKATARINKTPKINKKSRPYEVKKMKKNITQQWKQISNAIAASTTPDATLQADFLKVCQAYGQRAEDEWRPLWQKSVAAMKQLFTLAQEGNFQEASLLLTAVNNQKKLCHKKYK